MLSNHNNLLAFRKDTLIFKGLLISWKVYLFLVLFGAVLNNIVQFYNFPGIFTIFRLGIFIGIICISEISLKSKKQDLFFYFFFLSLVLAYLLVSVFQHNVGMGFYFIRLYIEPLLIMYYAKLFIDNYIVVDKLKSYIIILSIFAVLVSISSLFLFYIDPSSATILHGGSRISARWFLGGAVIYRAGFPVGGPNQQGLYYAAVIMLCLTTTKSMAKNKLPLFLLIIGLMSTFSKSAILATLIFYIIHTLFIYKRWGRFINLIGIIILMIGILIPLNKFIFNNFLNDYLIGLIEFQDSSTIGHLESVVSAVKDFHEYAFWGYEKGTVGSRARIFTVDYVNVENSLFILIYDMGIWIACLYILAFFSIMYIAYNNKNQIPYMLSLLIPYLVLPLIQSLEVTTLVLILYMLIGRNYSKIL